MTTTRLDRRALQVAVAVGSLVPISAGAAGMIFGAAIVGATGTRDLDSHVRYLSGLLLAIGVAYVTTVPRIERHARRFRLLTMIVVVGGLGRLLSLFLSGVPSPAMNAALVMELVVTPALAFWQARVAVD